MKKIVNFFMEDKKRLLGIVIIGVFLFAMVAGFKGYRVDGDNGYTPPSGAVIYPSNDGSGEEETGGESEETVQVTGSSDLFNRQAALEERYGKPGEGFIWDVDGTLLSLGDPEASAEDVVGYYINGIRTLDFVTAQRYSRDSEVVRRFSEFHESGNTSSVSYMDNFYADMYTLALQSIQFRGITGTAPFADGKTVFFVDVEMLDLSSKDFWRNQKDYLYNELYIYSRDESDQTKAEQFVYDYVIDFYKNGLNDGTAPMRNVSISLTVEKFADLGTGWLVSRDNEVDDYCYYTDGNVVARDILDNFRTEGRDYVKEMRDSDRYYDSETGLYYDSEGHVLYEDQGSEGSSEESSEGTTEESEEGTGEGADGEGAEESSEVSTEPVEA